MRQRFTLWVVLAMLGLGVFIPPISAQGQTTTRWKGTDVSTLTDGQEVFLYNVGTGRFMIHGGDWGVQGRLFYNDSGKMLKVYKSGENYYFDTGQTTQKDGIAKYLICNVPGICCGYDSAWQTNNGSTDATKTYTIIFDGDSGFRDWTFVPVETDDGTDTYYMYQTLGGDKYWMGAVYGDNWGNHDGDGYGYLVSLSSSYDKATWSQLQRFDGKDKSTPKDRVSSVDNSKTPHDYAETMVQIFNADTKVSIDDLYKWRVVTKEQLLATMTVSDMGDGLSTNLTYLINDRGFERNDFSFFYADSGWVANRFAEDVIYTTIGEGRYCYTWGYRAGNGDTSARTNNQEGTRTVEGENYNVPVRLKAQFDDKYHDGFNGKVEAKFGYLEFEGVGTVSTYITAPENGTGIYRISAYGFYQGGNEAYLFATTKNPADLTLDDINDPNVVSKSAALKEVSGYDKSNKGSYTRNPLTKVGVIGAGYDFVYDKTQYYRELEISINGNDKIYFGVVKLGATKSSSDDTTGSDGSRVNYYHDTDWVGADQFEITYLGTANPLWFDERETEYQEIADNVQYNNRAIRLHRTFELGQWNSFVYPMNLTAVQVRNAFGDGTQVAELLGPGNLSGNTGIIDFQSVPLPAEGAAIKAGHFYIIKPQNSPLASSEADPDEPGKLRTYYNMGDASFVKADLPTAVGVKECKNETEGESIYSHATYFNETSIPAGSYVLGKHKDTHVYNMYYLKTDTTIKGFRGWITETNQTTTPASSKRISINGIYDDTTSIDGMPVVNTRNDGNVVYDLSGRKVADSETMGRLSKGIYVANGKKWIVK